MGYPLVNVYITDGKITMLLMGKLTKFRLGHVQVRYVCKRHDQAGYLEDHPT